MRGERRKKIGKDVENGSVDVYLAHQRRIFQEKGATEPPLIPNAQTLRNLKHEIKTAQYLDSDPVDAIYMLKNSSIGQNVIHEIGLDPFSVNIMSAHQIRLWNHFCNSCPLLMDSTSGIAQKFEKKNKKKSRSLFCTSELLIVEWDNSQLLKL